MVLRRLIARGLLAMAIAPLALGRATEAAASQGTAADHVYVNSVKNQTFTYTEPTSGNEVTCNIRHQMSAQTDGAYLVVSGASDVVGGPEACFSSFGEIFVGVDDGTTEDLRSYYSGYGGHVFVSTQFPASWQFLYSTHQIYFLSCHCYAPPVTFSPK